MARVKQNWRKERVDGSIEVKAGNKNGDLGERARKAGDRPQLGGDRDGGRPRDPGRRLLLAEDAVRLTSADCQLRV